MIATVVLCEQHRHFSLVPNFWLKAFSTGDRAPLPGSDPEPAAEAFCCAGSTSSLEAICVSATTEASYDCRL